MFPPISAGTADYAGAALPQLQRVELSDVSGRNPLQGQTALQEFLGSPPQLPSIFRRRPWHLPAAQATGLLIHFDSKLTLYLIKQDGLLCRHRSTSTLGPPTANCRGFCLKPWSLPEGRLHILRACKGGGPGSSSQALCNSHHRSKNGRPVTPSHHLPGEGGEESSGQPVRPWAQGHGTRSLLSQCLLIPCSVEGLGTLGGIWFFSRTEKELEIRRWAEGKRG